MSPKHFRFLESCVDYYETPTHLFLHANYKPHIAVQQLDLHTLRWLSLRDYIPDAPHVSGKTAILGHTPQAEILDLEYLKCIDTGCCNGGWLTALDIDSGCIWQANEKGELRE